MKTFLTTTQRVINLRTNQVAYNCRSSVVSLTFFPLSSPQNCSATLIAHSLTSHSSGWNWHAPTVAYPILQLEGFQVLPQTTVWLSPCLLDNLKCRPSIFQMVETLLLEMVGHELPRNICVRPCPDMVLFSEISLGPFQVPIHSCCSSFSCSCVSQWWWC